MSDLRLTTTPLAGLRPLDPQGQRQWEQITRELRDALSEEHARLFAEPVDTPDAAIDWYAEVEGPQQRLADLPEEQRLEVRKRLGTLIGDIENLASEYSASASDQRRRMGKALRNAIEVPGEDYIWMVGDQPVLTCWAFESEAATAPRGVLSTMIPAKAPPPPPPPPQMEPQPEPTVLLVERRTETDILWWLSWLLLLLLLSVIFYLLTTACGVLGATFLN
ncbi:MAG: hypothetical protein AAFZ09_18245, partial [Pseudomonadota bacterium]